MDELSELFNIEVDEFQKKAKVRPLFDNKAPASTCSLAIAR